MASEVLTGVTNVTLIEAQLAAPFTVSEIPTPDPRESEDCLTLDIIVPESIYNSNGSSKKTGGKFFFLLSTRGIASYPLEVLRVHDCRSDPLGCFVYASFADLPHCVIAFEWLDDVSYAHGTACISIFWNIY